MARASTLQRTMQSKIFRYPQTKYRKSYQFRRSIYNSNHQHTNGQSFSIQRLVLRPVLFTAVVGAASYTTAIVAEYERNRFSFDYFKWSQRKLTDFFEQLSIDKYGNIRKKMNRWWNSLHDGNKVAAVIIFINTGVFVLWKVPSLVPFMTKWFTCNPTSGRSLTLLTSSFSHFNWWHLGINMFVLWNFSPLACDILGREQFFATYVTAGVFASLGQNLYHLVTSNTRIHGLGASGALMAVLATVCLERPDTQLSIVFLPFFVFPITYGLAAIIALDVTGLLMRWQFLSHSAHLSGALFGGAYIRYGQEYIWGKRKAVAIRWHQLREKFRRY